MGRLKDFTRFEAIDIHLFDQVFEIVEFFFGALIGHECDGDGGVVKIAGKIKQECFKVRFIDTERRANTQLRSAAINTFVRPVENIKEDSVDAKLW